MKQLEIGSKGEVTLTIDSAARLSTYSDDAVQAADLDEVVIALQREFTHRNPSRVMIDRKIEGLRKRAGESKKMRQLLGALYGQQKGEPVAIPTWSRDGSTLALPRGGTARARSILEDHGYSVRFKDARTEGTGPRARYEHKVELWPFQRDQRDAAMKMEQGVIRSPTGSGKSETLIALAVQAGLCALIIVWTDNLMGQWVRRLMAGLGLREDEVGVIQGGTRRVRPVTVGMQQTLVRHVETFAPVFGFVAADECHRVPSKTYIELMGQFPARYRFGASAEERRKDGKEFLLYDVIGDVVADVDKGELIEGGFILDVEVWVVETSFTLPWYEALSGEEKGARFGELLDAMVVDGPRCDLASSLALEVAQESGEQVLVFTHRVEHARRLHADVARTEARSGLLLGGKEAKQEFERTRVGILSGEVRVAVGTYQAVGTGTDLPSLARGVATTPIHNNRPFIEQVKGRICRVSSATQKSDARLYVLWDRAIFGLAPLKNLCRWSNVVKLKDAFTGEWVDGHERLREIQAAAKAEREKWQPVKLERDGAA